MESLGEKMDLLAVDDEERTSIASYFCKLKEKKGKPKNFRASDNYFVIEDKDKSKLVLLKKIFCNSNDHVFFCFKCESSALLDNISNFRNLDKMKAKRCIHSKVSEVLFREDKNLKNTFVRDTEILVNSPSYFVGLIKADKGAGVVVVNSRGGKSICHTCAWQYCAHLKKYRDNENNEALEDESDDEEKLPQRKLPRQKKQTSSLIPDGKKGADANIFGIIIEHPPTGAEKILINKINKEDSFPKKLMIPALDKIFRTKNFV